MRSQVACFSNSDRRTSWRSSCQHSTLAPLTLAAIISRHLLNAIDDATRNNLPRLNPAPELAARFFGRPSFRRRRHPVVVLGPQTRARRAVRRLPGHVRAGRWIIVHKGRRPIEQLAFPGNEIVSDKRAVQPPRHFGSPAVPLVYHW